MTGSTRTWDLHRDGFHVVGGVIPCEDVEALTRALDGLRPGDSPSLLDRGGQIYAGRNLLNEVPP